jgi:hypothetical protein
MGLKGVLSWFLTIILSKEVTVDIDEDKINDAALALFTKDAGK